MHGRRYSVEYKKDVVKLMVIDGLRAQEVSENIGVKVGRDHSLRPSTAS